MAVLAKQIAPVKLQALCLVLLALILSAPFGYAQGTGTCTLTGTVYDVSGAVIPSANVHLTLQTTGTTRHTTADAIGFFSFVGVPAGTYDLKVASAGFADFVQKGIILHINDQVDLRNIELKVATTGTAVEVTADTPVVPVSSGETSYTLNSRQVDELAIVGRNAVELLKIIPGAQNSGGWNGQYNGEVAGFNAGAGAYTVNGTRFDQMAVVSDGGNVIDHSFNGGAMVTPNVEMVQEVKLETASYSAENPNGPIVLETITKSGGRNFHGTGYYSIRDSTMNANDWQNNRYSLAKPASRFQYPGFNLGGPVLLPGTNFNRNRDKLFFFAGFEWMRQSVDLGVHRTVVPTAAMRTGDFSDTAYAQTLLPSIVNTPVCQGALASYCQGPGVIKPSAIDPGGSVLMKVYPLPNANPATTGGYNYLSDIVNPQPRNQQLVKLDYNLTDSTHLSARYNHEGETVPFPYGLWQTWPQSPYPGGVVTQDHSHSLATNLTHTFSPTLTNQLTFTASTLFYGAHLSTPDRVSA
ncbi:MAG: carboxypeptidase-like regulatory domain-containing protein, partial [Bryobacteraceae bacterium]